MTRRPSGRISPMWCWVAVFVSLSAGCGTGSSAPDKVVATPTPEMATSLEAIAAVVAGGGSVDYATRPEGGAVLVGAVSREGDGQRFDPAGLVVDGQGEVTVAFELPQATDVRSITVTGGQAVVLGMACEGVSREDDTTGDRNCVPGVMVAFEVDTSSGEVTLLELPDEAAVPTTNADVIGVGRDGLLLTALTVDGDFFAWSRTGVGEWR